MNIFESLEELNVSEECFEDIMGIIEELLNESLLDISDKLYDKHQKKVTRDSIEDAKRIADQNVANTKSVRRHVNKQRHRKGYDENIDYKKVRDNVNKAVQDREELNKLGVNGYNFDLNPLTQKAQEKKKHAEDATIKHYEEHASGERKPALTEKGMEKLRDLKRRQKMKEPSEETKRDFRLAHKAWKTFNSVKRPHEKNNDSQRIQRLIQLDRNRDKGNYNYRGEYEF